MPNETYTSSCWCGAVGVELNGPPAVMAYCHCASCRRWLSAPVHAAALWPIDQVRVSKGEDQLTMYASTEASLRHSCKTCGSGVLVRHPALGMIDVPAGSISGLAYEPTLHVNYGEQVLAIRDGLPKFKDFPEGFGGSGETLPE